MRRIFFLVVFLVFLLSTTEIRAGGFGLTSIGGVDTSGKQLSHWWYTSTRPTFRGVAESSVDIIFDIDGTALQIGSDSSGDWVFTPESGLSEGDHNIKITSNGSEISFVLTIGTGNVNWDAVDSGSAPVLPAAGFILPSLLMMGGGSVLTGIGARKIIRNES